VQSVRAAAGVVDDAVAGGDLGDLAVVPGEPAAAEDVEDLLRPPVLVRRRRPRPLAHLDPPEAHSEAAGVFAQVRPDRMQVADLVLAPPRLVEVREPHVRCLL
jgi:hypothetical protein